MNTINIEDYGYTQRFQTLATQYENNLTPARITAVFQGIYEIVTNYGISRAKLKGSYLFNMSEESQPTVGDFVMVDYHEEGISMIHHLLQRSSSLIRRAPIHAKQVSQTIGANIDYCFITTSMNKDFNPARIERYLTSIYQGGITPVIILSKSDLCDNPYDYISKLNDVALGVEIITTSAKTMDGVDKLKEFLKPGKTVIFMGSSGVGKSSLLNAVAGKELMHVNTIREDDDKGRHTTTHRQLVMLDNGCMLIDTPGMRGFLLIDSEDYVDETFADIIELSNQCHFSDCTHNTEIKCAVKQAIADGTLDEHRLRQYNKQKKQDAYNTRKDYMTAKKNKEKKYYQIGKQARKKKSYDGYDY